MGAELVRGWWHFSAEGGAAVELLRRAASRAQPGASAKESATFWRVGPQILVGARYQLAQRVALKMALASAYFPQHIRYTLVRQSQHTLASPWPVTATALLGLEFSLLP
jgi:hypothetical protein